MGFDSKNEYKPGIKNQAADTCSRIYKEGNLLMVAFMPISHPIVRFFEELQIENKSLKELRDVNLSWIEVKWLKGFDIRKGFSYTRVDISLATCLNLRIGVERVSRDTKS